MTMRDYGSYDCERFADHLMEHLEGDDDAATRIRMETHAASCDACAALLADLRTVERDAAHLPTLAPSRDLWPEIAARIEAPVIALGAGARDGRGTTRRPPAWLRPVAAAAALMLATAGVTYYATRERGAPTQLARQSTPAAPSVTPEAAGATPSLGQSAPEPQVASVPSAASGAGSREAGAGSPSPTAVPVANRKLSADETYDLEIRRLRAIVRQRRAQMDTSTLNVIERNLDIIDTAIAQCRAALARDPNSRFLLDNLNGALDTKVQLLRTAAMLPART